MGRVEPGPGDAIEIFANGFRRLLESSVTDLKAQRKDAAAGRSRVGREESGFAWEALCVLTNCCTGHVGMQVGYPHNCDVTSAKADAVSQYAVVFVYAGLRAGAASGGRRLVCYHQIIGSCIQHPPLADHPFGTHFPPRVRLGYSSATQTWKPLRGPPYKRLPFPVVCASPTYFGPVGVQKFSGLRGLRGSR